MAGGLVGVLSHGPAVRTGIQRVLAVSWRNGKRLHGAVLLEFSLILTFGFALVPSFQRRRQFRWDRYWVDAHQNADFGVVQVV